MSKEWLHLFTDPLEKVWLIIIPHLPHLFVALLLVLAGFLLAILLRFLTHRFLTKSFQNLSQSKGVSGKISQGGMVISRLVPILIYWGTLVFFFAAGLSVLNLPAFSQIFAPLATYVPKVMIGLVIILLGVLAGEFFRKIVTKAAAHSQVAYSDSMGRAIQIFVLIFAIILGIDQMGLDSTILILGFGIFLGCVFGAFALAFGFGARILVENLLANHYLQKQIAIGDYIQIGGVKGRVKNFQQTAVVLDTKEGDVFVPAITFQKEISTLNKEK